MYRLTEEQKTFYKENGYLVVYGVFSEEQCDEIQRICRKHADKDFASIMNLDRREPSIRAVMKHPDIVSILEELQGREVVGLMSQVLFKEANSPYAKQAWNPHQDNAYPQNPNGQYITINIALEDQYKENGCLYIYPGSHKEGLYPCTPTVSYHEKPGTNPGNAVDPAILARFKRVDVPIKKGGVLIMHGDVVHGSYPNLTDKNRPLLSISYISKGEFFIPGKNARRMEIPLR